MLPWIKIKKSLLDCLQDALQLSPCSEESTIYWKIKMAIAIQEITKTG